MIDVGALSSRLSEEAPAGPSLEYDPAFGELVRLAKGKPPQYVGERLVAEAEEPDWEAVRRVSLEIGARTRDLRVTVVLAQSLLKTEGWGAFREGLVLLRALLDQHWDHVHPQLDPEDRNDPTQRVNILAELCGADFVRRAREIPLVDGGPFGRPALRDVLVAAGRAPAPAPGGPPPMTAESIEGAFMSAPLDALVANEASIASCLDEVRALEKVLAEKVGPTQAIRFDPLVEVLRGARQAFAPALEARGQEKQVAEGEGGMPEETAGTPALRSRPGEITTRQDAVRMMEKICEYFRRHEPSSPVPILIERAKRLVDKDFLEVMRDLAPNGVAQVEAIRGTTKD